MKISTLTVGPVGENTYIVFNEQSCEAIVFDPGDEPDRIAAAIDEFGADVKAILITHCHFDHIGAVAPLAAHTGAEVWVPKIERPLLADIMSYVPWPGIGPFENYQAEHDVAGGERLELAGFEIDVIATPGHSPGHVTYSIPAHKAIFSGDVLFEGSVGRTDLPGGSTETLVESIRAQIYTLPDATRLMPGHGPRTTVGKEKVSNPFVRA